MCHPGLVSTPDALIQRRAELDALTAPEVRAAVVAAGVELATYAALAG